MRARRGRVHLGILLGGLTVVAILVAILASGFGKDPREIPSMLVGKPAPPFTLKTLDGKQDVRLEDFRGKMVVVNFWSTWCQPCKLEHPILQQAPKNYPDVQFIGVIYSDEAVKARRYLEREGSTYPNLDDPGNRTAIDYGVGGVPETFFIGPDGTVVYKQVGPMTAYDLAQLLRGR